MPSRSPQLARLEPQVAAARAKLAALPVAQPPEQIGHTAILLMVLLIEALKALGLFATTRRAPAPAAQKKADDTAAGAKSTPAADLARHRWNLKREAEARKAAAS